MWTVRFSLEAVRDISKIDYSIKPYIYAGIKKVSQNPLPKNEGGFGNPLGNKNGYNLTGFFKIKYRGKGIRVIYTLVRNKKIMNVIVVSQRDNEYCYKLAQKMKNKYGNNIFKDMFQ